VNMASLQASLEIEDRQDLECVRYWVVHIPSGPVNGGRYVCVVREGSSEILWNPPSAGTMIEPPPGPLCCALFLEPTMASYSHVRGGGITGAQNKGEAE